MPRKTQAEFFIEALSALVDAERESEKARRQRQHKVRAERYIEAHKTDPVNTFGDAMVPLHGGNSGLTDADLCPAFSL